MLCLALGLLFLAAACGSDPAGGAPEGSFCAQAKCGAGTCNEAARRCDCPAGQRFNPATSACVGEDVDLCAGVTCASGEICSSETGKCVGTCTPDRTSGDFSFCAVTSTSGYLMAVKYNGGAPIDLAASETLLNGKRVDLALPASSLRSTATSSGSSSRAARPCARSSSPCGSARGSATPGSSGRTRSSTRS
jgi:hypothetical protein